MSNNQILIYSFVIVLGVLIIEYLTDGFLNDLFYDLFRKGDNHDEKDSK